MIFVLEKKQTLTYDIKFKKSKRDAEANVGVEIECPKVPKMTVNLFEKKSILVSRY